MTLFINIQLSFMDLSIHIDLIVGSLSLWCWHVMKHMFKENSLSLTRLGLYLITSNLASDKDCVGESNSHTGRQTIFKISVTILYDF